MDSIRAHSRTLFSVGLLHACTHLYHVALLPLYLLIQRDLALESVEKATFLVTILMIAYYLPSYLLGALADHWNRKKLLFWGLVINALGFIALSFAKTYPAALAAVIISGLGGSCYHPAATALIARLFPVGTGKALGFIGIGASVGFFAGPIYTGWRAAVAGWRAPVLECGLFGLAVAILFWFFSEDDPAHDTSDHHREAQKLGIPKAIYMILGFAALAFMLRDFAGSSMASLVSLFLQKAHGFTTVATGGALASIFLASAISNPLFGHLSDKNRLPWTAGVLVLSAILVFVFPFVPATWSTLVLAAYGFFFLASFPMVEAALMESIHDAIRGRVFGLFITIGGVLGNIAHWFVGDRVKAMGAAANSPAAFYPLYSLIAILMLLSLSGLPLLRALRKHHLATRTA
ncbi:MAG TPA: MFS transporter [Methylomirabilota bacterium]|nr:MFS transporter [Methylomirabilota bacterium]